MVSIEKLIEGLCGFADEDFHCDSIYQFLSENPVDLETISPFVFWSKNFYTRNLVYKDERFELMAICWDKGQVSKVHNHSDQMCWMSVPYGKLRGQNFRVVDIDEKTDFCKLEPTDIFDLSECLAAKVELEAPIHQILNLTEFDERAISIHIYSKPFDNCLSYCLETDTFKSVPLFYTSLNGKLREGVTL